MGTYRCFRYLKIIRTNLSFAKIYIKNSQKTDLQNYAPKSHASTATTYGLGTASMYGHVKLSDTYTSKTASGAAANGLGASQNALYNAYNTLNTKLINTNVTLTLSSSFQPYNNNSSNNIHLYKCANVVYCSGIITPKNTITGSISLTTISTVPSGYRPVYAVRSVMHGSDQNIWMFQVDAEGTMSFSIYSVGNTYQNATNGTWLPIIAV